MMNKMRALIFSLVAGLLLLPAPAVAQESPSLAFEATEVTLDVGEETEVSILAQGDLDTNVVTLALDFNDAISITSLREGPGTLALDKTIDGTSAGVTIAKTDSNYADGDIVATLKIRLIDAASATISFSDATEIAEEPISSADYGSLTIRFANEDLLTDTAVPTVEPEETDGGFADLDPALQFVIAAGAVVGILLVITLAVFVTRKSPQDAVQV